MTKFISFGSGSSGNCYYLQADGYGILIDMGISRRRLMQYFRTYGLVMPALRAIVVTHEHADHVKYVGALSEAFHLPVYATEATHRGMTRNYRMTVKVPPQHVHVFPHDTTLQLGPFSLTSFAVPHDSSDNAGYYITCGNTRLCLITDAGSVTPQMAHYIGRADHIVVEANYDERMLDEGPYPAYLKRRIRADRGHLPNSACADLLARCAPPDVQHVWLCHLSAENNTPERARAAVVEALEAAGRTPEQTAAVIPLPRTSPSLLYDI